jgi:hypothetical protein
VARDPPIGRPRAGRGTGFHRPRAQQWPRKTCGTAIATARKLIATAPSRHYSLRERTVLKLIHALHTCPQRGSQGCVRIVGSWIASDAAVGKLWIDLSGNCSNLRHNGVPTPKPNIIHLGLSVMACWELNPFVSERFFSTVDLPQFPPLYPTNRFAGDGRTGGTGRSAFPKRAFV